MVLFARALYNEWTEKCPLGVRAQNVCDLIVVCMKKCKVFELHFGYLKVIRREY